MWSHLYAQFQDLINVSCMKLFHPTWNDLAEVEGL